MLVMLLIMREYIEFKINDVEFLILYYFCLMRVMWSYLYKIFFVNI